jgi:carbonic anhydrase/acetyltransferase-like protein (isoleucine patch superfamily)
MTGHRESVYALGAEVPDLHPTSYIAPGARVIGRVRLGAEASVWFNAVLRGDLGAIEIGAGSNIQDNTTVHVEGAEERGDGRERGTVIGSNVTVGHNCVIHSCVLEDECVIGMGAVVMGGATVGRGAVIGAGAIVLEETRIPPYALAVGNPAQVKKIYAPDFVRDYNLRVAEVYRGRIARFRHGLVPVT